MFYLSARAAICQEGGGIEFHGPTKMWPRKRTTKTDFLDLWENYYCTGCVSKIHCITSGMTSSYVDNKNNLYQCKSGSA
jgi:hypothetical protein